MCKVLKVLFGLVIFGTALVLGILVVVAPHERIHEIMAVSRFFEAMLPVLAVGALIKYLACCGKKKDCQ